MWRYILACLQLAQLATSRIARCSLQHQQWCWWHQFGQQIPEPRRWRQFQCSKKQKLRKDLRSSQRFQIFRKPARIVVNRPRRKDPLTCCRVDESQVNLQAVRQRCSEPCPPEVKFCNSTGTLPAAADLLGICHRRVCC